jgi:photosystem II stability/assembly factor-like uncharacterized protein
MKLVAPGPRVLSFLAVAFAAWFPFPASGAVVLQIDRPVAAGAGEVELRLEPADPGDRTAEWCDVERLVLRSGSAQQNRSAETLSGRRGSSLRLATSPGSPALLAATVIRPAGDRRQLSVAKRVVASGDGLRRPNPGFLSPIGLPAEIVPFRDPTLLEPGEDLPLRLLVRGNPAAGALLDVRSPQGLDPTRLRASESGFVHLRIDSPGEWQLSFEAPRAGEAEPIVSTLSFRVDPRSLRAGSGPATLPLFGTPPEAERCPGSHERWSSLGPAPIATDSYSGRVSALAVGRQNPSLVFAGGADGGVWKSTDSGGSWTALTDRLPSTAIGALELDPTDDRIVWAGSGEANFANHSRYGLGLYRSTDAGASWKVLGSETFAGRAFSRIVVDPRNGARILVAATRAGGFPEMAAAKGHPDAAGEVGLFESTDRGESWARLGGGLPALSVTDLVQDPSDPTRLFAAVGHPQGSPDNGVWRSTDGGAGWKRLSGGFPTGGIGRIGLAAAPSRPGRLYALVARAAGPDGSGAGARGAWRSDDGGTSWTSLPVGDLLASYGWYFTTIGVDPDNADRVVMGGLEMRRSTDAGASWISVTPPHVDVHAALFRNGALWVGDDGGVHLSKNGGDGWEARNSGLGTIQFYAGISLDQRDGTILLGGMQDNGSNLRDSSGEWTSLFGGDGGWTEIDPTNPAKLFVEFQGSGNLYRSADGGRTMLFSGSGIATADRNCFLPPYRIDPTNPKRMLYGTHRVWQSTTGGTSWSASSGDLTNGAGAIRALALAPSDPKTVWVATNDGNVAVSVDGGTIFRRVASGIPGWPRVTNQLAVDPADPATAWLAVGSFGAGRVRRTRDRGESWEVVDGDLPDVPVNVVALDPASVPPIAYVGTDAGIFRSNDDGKSWQPFGSGMPNSPVVDLRIDVERNRIVAATMGRGAWVRSLSLCEPDPEH